MSSLPPIAIIFFDDDQSRKLVDKLTSKSFSHQTPTFLVRDFSQNKDPILVLMALQKFYEAKTPLLLLISTLFFETIWISSYKPKIQNLLLNYSTKLCTHIWMGGVTEEYVERYSTGLLRNDDGFRRMYSANLLDLDKKELLDTIIDSLTDVSSQGNAADEYFSLQDDEKIYPVKGISLFSEIKMKDVSPLSSISSNSSSNSSTTSKTSSSSKKKKGKKKANTGGGGNSSTGAALITMPGKMYLNDLTKEEKSQLAKSLDPKNGVSYREIAYMYNFNKKDVDFMESSGKTIALINELIKRNEKLKIHDFRLKCQKILRNDVVVEIDKILFKK